MTAHECAQGRCIWCGATAEHTVSEPCPVPRATSLRQLGSYCPTPGAPLHDEVWRDPARPVDRSVRSARSDLALLVGELGDDEVRVLLYIARRLEMGARQYGRLDLATDRRDWRVELGQEAADALVYAACAALTETMGGER